MNVLDFFFDKIKHYSLRRRLVYIYATIYCIFLLLLIIVLSSVLGDQLFEHERSMLNNTLEQSVVHLETQMNDAINLSNVIQNNDDIISAVNVAYGKKYFQMYIAYANIIKPELGIYKSLIPEVTDIFLYSSCGLYPNKDYVQDLSVLEEMSWFPQVRDIHSPTWIVTTSDSQPVLASVRKLPKNKVYPFDNYLYLELDYENFFASTNTISSGEYGLIILDSNRNLVYEYDSFENDSKRIDAESFKNLDQDALDRFSQKFLFLTAPVDFADWTIYYYSPLNNIQWNVSKTIFTVFSIIALCFTLLLSLTLYLINTLLSPLQQVTEQISQISLNDIEKAQVLTVSNTSNEVNALVHTFNAMLKRIQNLIEEAYVRNLMVKEYQLKSLRAQINPHFLYNTLSTINARAIIAEQKEISETVQLLSTFYRTSLNKGKDFTTVEEEIKNVQSYISIQLILTNRSFTVDYQLDENLFPLPVPCFILQPLVENAIEHGLLVSRKKEKHLSISLFPKEDLCHILIRDNGCGIPKEISDTIFSLERSHIGIKNVNERLKLSYGDSMGLIINSLPDSGTEAIVRIPISSEHLD